MKLKIDDRKFEELLNTGAFTEKGRFNRYTRPFEHILAAMERRGAPLEYLSAEDDGEIRVRQLKGSWEASKVVQVMGMPVIFTQRRDYHSGVMLDIWKVNGPVDPLAIFHHYEEGMGFARQFAEALEEQVEAYVSRKNEEENTMKNLQKVATEQTLLGKLYEADTPPSLTEFLSRLPRTSEGQGPPALLVEGPQDLRKTIKSLRSVMRSVTKDARELALPVYDHYWFANKERAASFRRAGGPGDIMLFDLSDLPGRGQLRVVEEVSKNAGAPTIFIGICNEIAYPSTVPADWLLVEAFEVEKAKTLVVEPFFAEQERKANLADLSSEQHELRRTVHAMLDPGDGAPSPNHLGQVEDLVKAFRLKVIEAHTQ